VFSCNAYAYILKKVWKSKRASCIKGIKATIYLRLTDFMRRHKLYNPKKKVVFIVHSMLFDNKNFSLTSLKQQLGFQGGIFIVK
jgi:hypothetical protein